MPTASILQPEGQVTVGQPVTVAVEVFVPTWFTGAPRFPDLDVKDALVLFNDRGVNLTERVGTESWAGQSRSYDIYPQRAGTVTIDAIPVMLKYATPGAGSGAEATVSPPALTFTAVLPPEAEGLGYFIATPRLELAQSFDREPGTFAVGEAFTRTVTVTVQNALSMVVPPLPSTPVDGLAVYPDPPRVEDAGGERGTDIVGTRVESVTYVAQEEGDYTLPAVELAWWDTVSGEMRRATLPEVTFTVVPAATGAVAFGEAEDEIGETEDTAAAGHRVGLVGLVKAWGLPAAGLALLAWANIYIVRRFLPAWQRRLETRRRRRAEAEATWFARFRANARSGDPRATWQAWTSWLDRRHTGPGAATIRDFVERAGDDELRREAAALDRAIFGARSAEERSWSPRNLVRAVTAARRRLRREQAEEDNGAGLEPLNP